MKLIGILVAFLVLSLIFLALERIWPGIRGQRLLRKGFWVDIGWWFFTPLITKRVARLAIILAVILLAVLLGIQFEELKNRTYTGFGPLGRQPLWLQTIEVFTLGDFIGYWMHRLFHRGRSWPFHPVHHTS